MHLIGHGKQLVTFFILNIKNMVFFPNRHHFLLLCKPSQSMKFVGVKMLKPCEEWSDRIS